MQRKIVSGLVVIFCAAVAPAADWPQWRGAQRDGVSKEAGLHQEWPAGGPALRWKATDIGTGYSSPAIAGGRVYLQTTRDNDEFLLALDEKSGEKVWSVPIGKVGPNRGPQYPGTRSTPTIDGDFIYCLASAGELACLTRADGKLIWAKNLQTDLEGKPGNWAYSESVLIDGDALVCTPGGESATLASLNKTTGSVLWKSSVPGLETAEYSSIMIAGAGDSKEYVQFLRKALIGVDAKTGKFLWRYDRTIDPGANIPTPIVVGNRIFSSGSRSGGALLELKTEGDGATVSEKYFDPALAASIGGSVLVDGKLYGTTRQVLFCADFATGKVLWADRAGIDGASICSAGGRLYVRNHKSGDVALVEPSAEAYREKGRFAQPDRSDKPAWPHPVVANGGLYLRDQGVLLCYDVKGPAVAAAEPARPDVAPPIIAKIETTLTTAGDQVRQLAFDGKAATFFRSSQNLAAADHFSLILEKPVAVRSVSVVTGDAEGRGKLDGGTLEISTDGSAFEQLAKFTDGCAGSKSQTPRVQAIRLRPGSDQDQPLVVREIRIESDPPVAVFQYPVEFAVDVTDAPDMQEWADRVAQICVRAYPMINEELKSDGFRPARLIKMTLSSNYEGVAAASGTQITGSVKFFKDHPDDVGAMVHETAHVVQNYRGRGNPGWLVEGVADYVRFFKFEPGNLGPIDPNRARYNSSYRVTAAFLAYVTEKYDRELVLKLNKLMRDGNYREEIFKDLTGKTVQELDEEWRETLKR